MSRVSSVRLAVFPSRGCCAREKETAGDSAFRDCKRYVGITVNLRRGLYSRRDPIVRPRIEFLEQKLCKKVYERREGTIRVSEHSRSRC